MPTAPCVKVESKPVEENENRKIENDDIYLIKEVLSCSDRKCQGKKVRLKCQLHYICFNDRFWISPHN